MSEREIRVFAKLAVDSYPVSELIEAYFAAMHEEPDLVVLLRWLARGWRQVPKWSETATTFETVIDHINKTVRLTDDGWEWVHED